MNLNDEELNYCVEQYEIRNKKMFIPTFVEQQSLWIGGFESAKEYFTQNEENKMQNQIMQYFEYKHLPEKLQSVSKQIGELAKDMDQNIPDGPEKSAGLRKLLEAKDCFVRAKLS